MSTTIKRLDKLLTLASEIIVIKRGMQYQFIVGERTIDLNVTMDYYKPLVSITINNQPFHTGLPLDSDMKVFIESVGQEVFDRLEYAQEKEREANVEFWNSL